MSFPHYNIPHLVPATWPEQSASGTEVRHPKVAQYHDSVTAYSVTPPMSTITPPPAYYYDIPSGMTPYTQPGFTTIPASPAASNSGAPSVPPRVASPAARKVGGKRVSQPKKPRRVNPSTAIVGTRIVRRRAPRGPIQSEAQRIASMENDPCIVPGSVEVHRVQCLGCRNYIMLDRRSRYYPYLWTKHRKRCRGCWALEVGLEDASDKEEEEEEENVEQDVEQGVQAEEEDAEMKVDPNQSWNSFVKASYILLAERDGY